MLGNWVILMCPSAIVPHPIESHSHRAETQWDCAVLSHWVPFTKGWPSGLPVISKIKDFIRDWNCVTVYEFLGFVNALKNSEILQKNNDKNVKLHHFFFLGGDGGGGMPLDLSTFSGISECSHWVVLDLHSYVHQSHCITVTSCSSPMRNPNPNLTLNP